MLRIILIGNSSDVESWTIPYFLDDRFISGIYNFRIWMNTGILKIPHQNQNMYHTANFVRG